MDLSLILRVGHTAAGLIKDPTAWMGSIVSSISLKVTSFALLMPTSLEGWAAVAASIATLVYVASKTWILWKNHGRNQKQAEKEPEVPSPD
jgi:hypothetical protein